MLARQDTNGALCGSGLLQINFNVVHRNTQGRRVLFSGQNYFPGLEGVPVRENKKVTFLFCCFCVSGLLPAPVLPAGEQAGAGSAHLRPKLTPAGVSRNAGGQGKRRHNSWRPTVGETLGARKILQRALFLEPSRQATHCAHV